MDDWKAEALETPMAGISAMYWIQFFSLFAEGKSREEIEAKLDQIACQIRSRQAEEPWKTTELMEHIEAIVDLAYGNS
jgi:hypothetical protein